MRDRYRIGFNYKRRLWFAEELVDDDEYYPKYAHHSTFTHAYTSKGKLIIDENNLHAFVIEGNDSKPVYYIHTNDFEILPYPAYFALDKPLVKYNAYIDDYFTVDGVELAKEYFSLTLQIDPCFGRRLRLYLM